MRMTDAKRKKENTKLQVKKRKNSIKDLCDLFVFHMNLH